jgi:hypothetical protein
MKTARTVTARGIELCLNVEGAHMDLAQWLLDHPQYPDRTIAEWLRCEETRIRNLRRWAARDFEGKIPL